MTLIDTLWVSGSPPLRSLPFLIASLQRKSFASSHSLIKYWRWTYSFRTLARIAGIKSEGVSSLSALTTPLSTVSTWWKCITGSLRNTIKKEDSVNLMKYLVVTSVWHHARAVDEEDTLHECYILPDLSLSRDRSSFTALLPHERVDNTWLARVGISDNANRYLTFILEKTWANRRLSHERDVRHWDFH